MLRVLLPKLATARSSFPSPLKSATATERGSFPTGKVVVPRKLSAVRSSSTSRPRRTGAARHRTRGRRGTREENDARTRNRVHKQDSRTRMAPSPGTMVGSGTGEARGLDGSRYGPRPADVGVDGRIVRD